MKLVKNGMKNYLSVVGAIMFLAVVSNLDAAKIKVACVGDSITYGAAIKEREKNCYPAQLRNLLGEKYEVQNFGRNGATLLRKGDLPYRKTPQFKAATDFEPDIVVLKLGTNDSKPQNWRHWMEYGDDLRDMINYFEGLPSKPRVHVCVPVPVYRDRWGINEKTVAGMVAKLTRGVAREEGIGWINTDTALRGHPEMFPDGIHPNAAGAKLMATVVAAALNTESEAADRFELLDGDRVVFLGDGLIEQEQYFGWIEVMMTTAFPDRDVTFRNLGWNADTPAGDSRFGLSLLQAGRAPVDEGWKQLQKQLELTKPTVLVLGYGMGSSLEGGRAGIGKFTADYRRLLTRVSEISPKARFVLLSPVQRLDSDHPQAGVLKQYSVAIKKLAEAQGGRFVDLLPVAKNADQRKDPIHLNEAGYREAAAVIGKSLGMSDSGWADNRHTKTLRDMILQKNQWWFHRSRPANMAYVFGFRKHEQGQNAVEIPQFDKLIAEDETRIASLRRLEPVNLLAKKPPVKSKYAKFTKQPTPQFTVGKDLEVTLWAENPQLNKPIQMNFDPQGRLWVASSEAYPMIEVGQAAPDKILVLEDTNGDGKSDKSTVFANGLLIPTGVEPGNGGVYVAQSTDLLFLKDTDGDGKADVRKRVLSGFGTEDTHHNLHTLRWGFDGRLYMNQSIYTRTDTETARGVVRLKAGGGFRYNTDSMRMEVFFRGLVNSWGHQFDEYGQSFLTDGAGFQGIAYTFPGASFRPTPGSRRDLALISPGNYPKFASKEIVYGDSFPKNWQGSIVTCDFRANRVTRFSLVEQGAGFVTQQEEDLLRTTASTFRPIDVKQGPDGALYIADWSNPIINHGEVDFRDARRDRWHGRIWRVSWKGGKKRTRTNIAGKGTRQLLNSLGSNDRYVRDQTRRVLFEQPEKTKAALGEWLRGIPHHDELRRLQALWLHQGLNVSNTPLLADLLQATEPRIRAAAVRVLADWADPETDLESRLTVGTALGLFRQATADPHPRVRLEAVRGVARLDTVRAAEVALGVLTQEMDRFLDYGLWVTMNELADPFMAALDQGKTAVSGKQLEFALASVEPVRAGKYIAQRLKQEPIRKDGNGPWIELIGKAGGREELKVLYQQAVNGGLNPAATERALNAIADAQRLRRLRPAGAVTGISQLIGSQDAKVQVAAIRLAGLWKLQGQVKPLSGYAGTGKTPAIRGAAITALAQTGGGPAGAALVQLAQAKDLGVARHAVLALAGLGVNRAAAPFYGVLGKSADEEQAMTMWRGFLANRNGGKALTESYPAKGMSQMIARAGLRAAREGGRNEPGLVAVLSNDAGITIKPEELTPARVAAMIRKANEDGHPGRGEAVYRRTELGCTLCHAIGGVGGKVGPDMVSLGASAPTDYIIESMYKPNSKIKEGYHSVIVETKDEFEYSGVEVSDSGNELVIRTAANQLVKIAKNNIASKRNGMSLMPSGLMDVLSEQERLDLIRFLSALGTPGNYDASQGGVARVYEVLAGTHIVEQNGGAKIISGEWKKGWAPFISNVSGAVSGGALRNATQQKSKYVGLVHIYMRTKVEAAKDGQVMFNVTGPTKVDLWVDGQQLKGERDFSTNLKAGKHTVLVRLDAKAVPPQLRLKSRDVSFAVE